MGRFQYSGDELTLFAQATNWKRYVGSLIAPYLVGDVLEVGAGIGGTTRVFCDGRQRSWTCLEPDAELARALQGAIDAGEVPAQARVLAGTLSNVPPALGYDAVLYIDVLEHIGDDRAELGRAASAVKPGGAIVVMSPAHQYLYTPFDRKIGHFRRYTRSSLRAITPGTTRLELLKYLDSAGMLVSLANRMILRSADPTMEQVRAWDRYFVPVSRHIDPMLGWRVGKSVLAVWRRNLTAGA